MLDRVVIAAPLGSPILRGVPCPPGARAAPVRPQRGALLHRGQGGAAGGAAGDGLRWRSAPPKYFSGPRPTQPKGEVPAGPLAFYAVLGVLCFAFLAKTLLALPLVPFQMGCVEWTRGWLMMTIVDYYGAVLPLCGVIVASEKQAKAALWCGERSDALLLLFFWRGGAVSPIARMRCIYKTFAGRLLSFLLTTAVPSCSSGLSLPRFAVLLRLRLHALTAAQEPRLAHVLPPQRAHLGLPRSRPAAPGSAARRKRGPGDDGPCQRGGGGGGGEKEEEEECYIGGGFQWQLADGSRFLGLARPRA